MSKPKKNQKTPNPGRKSLRELIKKQTENRGEPSPALELISSVIGGPLKCTEFSHSIISKQFETAHSDYHLLIGRNCTALWHPTADIQTLCKLAPMVGASLVGNWEAIVDLRLGNDLDFPLPDFREEHRS